MAKVEKFLLHSFDKELTPDMKVEVPEGSKLLRISSYPDGLYVWAEIPSITVPNFETLRFHNIGRDEDVPVNSEYYTTIEIFQEQQTPEGPQTAVMVNHIYKYK